MRMCIRGVVCSAALAMAAIFAPSSLSAMPIVSKIDLQAELGKYALSHKVAACWRYGRYGWGMYPGCYRPPVYVAPPVYVPPPVYVAPVPPRRCWINGRWRPC